MKKIILIVFLIIAIVFAVNWYKEKKQKKEQENIVLENEIKQEIIPEKKDRVKKIEVKQGTNYGDLMKENEIDYAFAMKIYDEAKSVYDLVKIKEGKFIELIYDKETDKLKEFRYKIDTEDELIIDLAQENWSATTTAIPYEIKRKTVEGKIESSLYQAALDQNIDIRAIIELANAFQWTLDFAMDPRVGDTFEFIFEERYLDGEYIMPGQVLAGVYVNDGTKFQVYYFEESGDNKGFFDENGVSVQKMFLKAPVEFKYISSGFTTGLRYVEAFNVSTGHRAIDYAAPSGTPIRAVGDGVITSATWSSVGYGNLMSLRHNGTYSTNYAHLSKFAVKKGQRVKQGDIIGYVGNTGFSTGPHLHYEMVKNGEKINPLKEVLPPGESIKEENKEKFLQMINEYGLGK